MKTTRPGPRGGATRTSRTTTTAARSPKKKKKISTKKIPAPSSPNMEKPSLPETTPLSSFASPLPVTFLPSTPSKKELSRLGGLRPVLKLLGSRKSSLSQTAALVLSNCTGEDREVCRALTTLEKIVVVVVEREEEERTAAAAAAAATHAGLGPLTEHLTDSDTIVALHVAKTLAHCTAACPNKEATLHLSGWLRSLGGLRLLIGCISPHTEHERMTSAVLLSLGNLCCDDAVLCSEMRALGALESLLLLLRPGRPLVLRDRATSTLLNCVEGVDGVFEEERLMERELSEVGAVSALCRAIETLIDGRSVADATAAASTSNQSNTRRMTEPMTCGLLDLLLRCCGSKNTGGGGKNTGGGSKNAGGEKNGEKSSETISRTSSRRSKQGSECDELHDCGGTQLLMILLDDVRPSVQERACRLLAYACESHGRNARDIKRSVWSSGGDGALVQLVALVQHKKRSVAKSARRCLDALRNRPSLIARKSSTVSSSKDSNDETISSTPSSVEESSSKSKGGKTSDDEVLLPLIEQGIVPIFWKMARPEIEMLEEAEEAEILENEREEKENKKKKNNSSSSKNSSKNSSKSSSKSKKERRKKGEEKTRKEAARRAETRGFAADYLLWLELAVDGGQQSGSATFRVLLRTLCMNGNEALRGNVAVALVILCFRNPSLRASFVREGALDATLSMLRQDAGRSHALEVLCTMEDVVSERVDLITLNKDASGAALTNPYAAAAAAGCDPPPADLLSEKHVNNPTSSDVTLSIRQTFDPNARDAPKQTLWTFHTHKSVLMCCSGFFRDLLQQEKDPTVPSTSTWEDEKHDVEVKSYDGFESLMRFVYTADERQLFKSVDLLQGGAAEEKVHVLLQIMSQAHDLGMGGARRLCANRLATEVGLLNETTLLQIFKNGVECGEDQLGMFCFRWCLENWMLLLRSWSEDVDGNTRKLIGYVRKFLVAEIVVEEE